MKFLDGEKFFYKVASGLNEIVKKKQHLNKINYFPVADGDTGTNLALTSNYIIKNSKINNSISDVAESIANAAFNGARGNSGIILAQFFQGISLSFKGKKVINVVDYSSAIKNAVDFAYDSVNEPIEGTILTVMKEWALSLHNLGKEVKDFTQLFSRSFKAAQKALNNTVNQLKVLKQHDVVDAGAKGFVLFLEGVRKFLKAPESFDFVDSSLYEEIDDEHEYSSMENIKYRYCCQFVLEETKLDKKDLIDKIGDFGNSLILARMKNKYKIHIHSSEPNKISTILNEYGNITAPVIEDMISQYNIKKMNKKEIAVVTDSTCDLPFEFINDNDIYTVPLNINFDKSEFIDKISIQPEDLYKYIKDSKETPKSSQPNIKRFINKYKTLLKKYDRIISVHLSKQLSGTYESALKAANIVDKNRIFVIDSKNLSTALGLLVKRISELISENKKFEEIIKIINKYKNRLKIYVSVKDLKYMIRGGRVSKAKGLFAKLLNLKPIISLDDEGKSCLIGKGFSFNGNVNKIVGIVEKKYKENSNFAYAIGHVQAKKEADDLADKLIRVTGENPQYITDVSPIIGTHAGIGSVSVSIIYE